MQLLHLISLILLTGTAFSLRYLVMPSVTALKADDTTLFMGKIMNRSRRVLRAGLLILIATGVYLFASRSASEPMSNRLLANLFLTLAVTLIVFVMSVSPHRRLALWVEPRRRHLLDAALALLIALTAVSHFD